MAVVHYLRTYQLYEKSSSESSLTLHITVPGENTGMGNKNAPRYSKLRSEITLKCIIWSKKNKHECCEITFLIILSPKFSN